MSKLFRFAVAVVVGLVAWAVVATLCNFVLRAAIQGYRAQEIAVSFTLVAQLGRLALGVISTAVAAALAVIISRGSVAAAVAVGCILLVIFLPTHVSLWHNFPIWYHLFFLASLPLGAWLFGKLAANSWPNKTTTP